MALCSLTLHRISASVNSGGGPESVACLVRWTALVLGVATCPFSRIDFVSAVGLPRDVYVYPTVSPMAYCTAPRAGASTPASVPPMPGFGQAHAVVGYDVGTALVTGTLLLSERCAFVFLFAHLVMIVTVHPLFMSVNGVCWRRARTECTFRVGLCILLRILIAGTAASRRGVSRGCVVYGPVLRSCCDSTPLPPR